MRRFGEAMARAPKYAKILEKRRQPPGKPKSYARKPARKEYAVGLTEKQKLKTLYDIRETQMRRYFEEAVRKPGRTGDNLLELLERRLDNIVYRLGFASTIWGARQLVGHGHVRLNGRRVNVRSHLIEPGDAVTVSEKMKANPDVQESLRLASAGKLPSYLEFDDATLTGVLVRRPNRVDIPVTVNESAIVEFYARQ